VPKKGKLNKVRVFFLILALAVGMATAAVLRDSSSVLTVLAAVVALVSLGISNLFQADKSLHYKEPALLAAAYASAAMLGVSLMQISDFLPEPFWMQ
jgi:drug/metabolite transporter (DMT)-like permease